jgi:hypothetical protein
MRKIIVFFLLAAMIVTATPAFAWGGGYHNRGHGYYRGGMRPWGWFGVGVASALVTGAIVDSIYQPRIVYVGQSQYYVDANGNYFVRDQYGRYIVVVPPQQVVVQPAYIQQAPIVVQQR